MISKIGFVRCICTVVLTLAMAAGLSGQAHASNYKVLYDFCARSGCIDGSDPQAGLVLDSNENLYGTTYLGGTIGNGTAFELAYDPAKKKWKHVVLHNFCLRVKDNTCVDGEQPLGKLIIDVNGNLYGTNYHGGSSVTGGGVIYELLPRAGSHLRDIKVLHTFCPSWTDCPDGLNPEAGLAYAGQSSGAPYDGVSPLYGTASMGSGYFGSVFELAPGGGGWSLQTLHQFCVQQVNCSDGAFPAGDLVLDSAGNVFGTLSQGYNVGGGVFELTRSGDSWTEAGRYLFCQARDCADGAYPFGGIVIDAAGDLLGTTSAGGKPRKGCCGVVFKLHSDAGNWQETVAYNFCNKLNCPDGRGPMSTLIADSAGNLFGTTSQGGGNNIDVSHLGGGTIFKLSGSSLEKLYSFCAQAGCVDGEYPYAGLVMDGSGNLFGTTTRGGKYDGGVVFELSP
jgi:uncharacterized repeat protein (TIGR03803 family)